jgi:hypothetical protein
MKFRILRFSKGQMAVVMTVALATLLGAMALGTDLAVVDYDWMLPTERRRYSRTRGSPVFSSNAPAALSNPNCPNGSLHGPNTNAENGACAYAARLHPKYFRLILPRLPDRA